MQAKIFFAVVSMTPAQVIAERSDARLPNMGLQTWAGDRVLSEDVTVGKNYLASSEIRELNRLTGILLDIFEDQLDVGRLTLMSEAAALLDDQLRRLGRAVLDRAGSPSRTKADAIAKERYRVFNERRRLEAKKEVDAELTELRSTAKALPKTSKVNQGGEGPKRKASVRKSKKTP